MRMLLAGLTAVAMTGFLNTTALADPYRWCADFGGGRGGGTSCYYNSFEQCRLELIGRGGFCRPNPFFDGRPVRTSGDWQPMPRRRDR